MPAISKIQDLRDDLRRAETALCEEKRKADPDAATRMIENINAQIKQLEARKIDILHAVAVGAQTVAAAEAQVTIRRQKLETQAGKGDIERLQKLVEAQLLKELGL